jgi:hypothetical protein
MEEIMSETWESGTWTPTPWGDYGGRNPIYYGALPDINFPQPTPGVEPSPYVPPSDSGAGGAVIDERPGFAPGNYFSSPGTGLPSINVGSLAARAAGGALGGPLGSMAANMLYNRFFGPDRNALPPPLIRNPSLPSGYDVPYFIRDPNLEGEVPQQDADGYMDWLDQQPTQGNVMRSRQREGSTRFSQGEMDLSNLPMYGAPGSLLPAVFAGERGSALPGGGQAPVQEMR